MRPVSFQGFRCSFFPQIGGERKRILDRVTSGLFPAPLSVFAIALFWRDHRTKPSEAHLSPFEAAVLVVEGERKGEFRFTFEKNEIIVGRSPGPQGIPVGDGGVTDPDPTISEGHFTLQKRVQSNGQVYFFIRDGEVRDGAYRLSKTGTFIDDSQLEPGEDQWYLLRGGERIQIGNSSLVFFPPADPFPEKVQSFFKALSSSAKAKPLLKAIERGDWPGALKGLVSLPRIPVVPPDIPLDQEIRSVPYWRHPDYCLALYHLQGLVREGIEGERITEIDFTGLNELMQRSKATLLSRLRTLEKLVAAPKYLPMKIAGDQPFKVMLDPAYKEQIGTLVRAVCEGDDADREELISFFEKHKDQTFLWAVLFPKTQGFFEEHFKGEAYSLSDPLKTLESLVFPDLIRKTTRKDPLQHAGYAEAVRELGAFVLALREARRGRIETPLPLEGIPALRIPSKTRREIRRILLSPDYESVIDELVRRGNSDAPVGRPEVFDKTIALPVISELFAGSVVPFYHGQIHGGRQPEKPLTDATFTFQQPVKEGDREFDNESWLYAMGGVGGAPEDQRGNLGRFYFAVKPEAAAPFWEELRRRLDQATQSGHKYQAKISRHPIRFAAGDPAVLYFRSNESAQKHFYDLAVTLAGDHPDWFHDTRPIFAARIKGPDGRWVKGLSFIQDSVVPDESANKLRALALQEGMRCERFLRIMGKEVSFSGRIRLMAGALDRLGVDLDHPAFNKGMRGGRRGVETFHIIFEKTDQ